MDCTKYNRKGFCGGGCTVNPKIRQLPHHFFYMVHKLLFCILLYTFIYTQVCLDAMLLMERMRVHASKGFNETYLTLSRF